MRNIKRRSVCVWLTWLMLGALLFTGCEDKLKLEEPIEQIPTLTQIQTEGMRKTILHYSLESGLLVPVVKSIPWVEDIAHSALEHMQQGHPSVSLLEDAGLRASIPMGVHYTVQVSETGVAYVDLRGVNNCNDAAAEQRMIQAMTATLLEFPAIDSVMYTLDGYAVRQLPYGTAVGDIITSASINLLAGEGSHEVVVYYATVSDLLVPVTRTINATANLQAAIDALYQDAPEGTGLLPLLPADIGVAQASLVEETAVIDFSSAAATVFTNDARAVRGIMMTCLQFDEIIDVVIRVGGEQWDIDAGQTGAALPTFLNEI